MAVKSSPATSEKSRQMPPRQKPVSPAEPPHGDIQETGYYAKVAARYRAAKYLTVFLLVLLLLGGLIMGSGSITYANFVYLLRDLDVVFDAVGGDDADILHYSTVEDRQYVAYRDGLVLVSHDGVQIYNRGGKRTLEDDPDYSAPHAVASDRYLLTYDRSGGGYTLYNSLSAVYRDTLDYPIHGAAISDSGYYALITETREYTSAVMLYNKNCKLVNRYLKDKYIIDAAISDDGERIAMVSVSSSEGDYLAEFQLCEPGKDSAIATLRIPGVFPMAVRFFSNNSFAVLCDEAIYFYNDNGELLKSLSFTESAPERFSLKGKYAALVYPANVMGTESRVCIFNSTGVTVSETVVEGGAQALAVTGDAAWVMTERLLFRVEPDGAVSSMTHGGGAKALLAVEEDILICNPASARRYRADDLAGQTAEN